MVKISGIYITMHTYCNFNCVYCWQKHSPTMKLNQKNNPMDIIKCIDYFFENYFIFYSKDEIINITFSGGESLFFAKELLTYIKQIRSYNNIVAAKINITIQTNGSLLTPEIIADLQKYKVQVFFSYDGYGQNITRKQNDIVLQNLYLLSKKVPTRVNTVIIPETSNTLYKTFQILKNTNIVDWGFGINFLEKEENYDKKVLLNEIKKISTETANFTIKNFTHQKDEAQWKKTILSYIPQITIMPDGNIQPTNFIFTGEKYAGFFNYSFGNINSGFNEILFNKYCNEKIEILKNMPISETTSIITPELIVDNLFNTTSRFTKNNNNN